MNILRNLAFMVCLVVGLVLLASVLTEPILDFMVWGWDKVMWMWSVSDY